MGIFHFAVSAATVKIDVDFQLTQFESSEGITNREIRLVIGQGKDWQSPTAGHKFVTDNEGRARFTVETLMDRRWISVPVAMTGVSIPKHADHLWIGAELEQFIQPAQGPLQRHPWLHCFDIDNISDGESRTTGFGAIYGRDAKAWFTVKGGFDPGPAGHLQMPELGGLMLTGAGYVVADFLLTPNPDKTHWTLRLVIQQKPLPVMR